MHMQNIQEISWPPLTSVSADRRTRLPSPWDKEHVFLMSANELYCGLETHHHMRHSPLNSDNKHIHATSQSSERTETCLKRIHFGS